MVLMKKKSTPFRRKGYQTFITYRLCDVIYDIMLSDASAMRLN